MTNKISIFIHIGYPKTASTWLQQIVFNNENLGFSAPWGGQSPEAIEQFVITDGFHFSVESVRQIFEPGLQEARRKGLIPVMSHESLAGNQIKGSYWGKEIADRIHAVFPNAHIFLVIREQKSMVLSSYREHIKKGGTKTIQQFIGAGAKKSGFAPLCRLAYLEYDLLINYYYNLFGESNILILPFEFLKQDKQAFVKKNCEFVGSNAVPVYGSAATNIGFQGATLDFRRQLNRFCDPAYFGPGGPPLTWRLAQKLSTIFDRFVPSGIHDRAEKHYKQFIADTVGSYFHESNQRTSRLIGMSLAELGYDC